MIAEAPISREMAERELYRRKRAEMLARGRPLTGSRFPPSRPRPSSRWPTRRSTVAPPAAAKSDWLLGTALTQHQSAIIFRREYPQVRAWSSGRARS